MVRWLMETLLMMTNSSAFDLVFHEQLFYIWILSGLITGTEEAAVILLALGSYLNNSGTW